MLDSADMAWDELIFQSKILAKECSSMTTTLVKGGDRQSIGLGFKNGFQANDAALYLRDELLRTTGQRIWGLTFTLSPDGKFKLDYNYTKPEGYEESDEPISPDVAMASLIGTNVQAEVEYSIGSRPEYGLVSQALIRLRSQTAEHETSWGLGHEAQWNLDLNSGLLRFTFDAGRIVEAGVQVVGTYNTQDGTFLWGWDHPSVPEPLRRAAQRVRDYGKDRGIERFTTRQIACTETEAWEFTAAAAQLDEAAGAYRGNANGTWVYMVFDEPKTV